MANLFVYGTLLNSEILLALTGNMFKQKDVLLKEYSRYKIFDGSKPRSYPALTEDKKGSVKGKILFNVDEKSLNILDYYENTEYIRKEIHFNSGGRKISASVYIWSIENNNKLRSSWDLKEFEKQFLNLYLEEIIPATLSEYQKTTGKEKEENSYMMTPQKFKACFFDIDGTLVRSDHTISPVVIDAIRRLEKEGVAPIIATGRSYEALLPVKEALGIHSPVICYNGAMVVNGKDGSVMTHHTLPDNAVRALISLARDHDLHILAYQEGRLIYEKERSESREYFDRIRLPGLVVDFNSLSEPLNFTKCLIIGDHKKLEPILERVLSEQGDEVNAFFSDPRFLEIVPRGIDKGRAVAEVMSLLGGTTEEAMAMGDGFNDLPMLKAARWGVVMENALPALRELFPPERTAPPCDEDGAATYLADFFGWKN